MIQLVWKKKVKSDDLDVDKLKTFTIDLKKLSNVFDKKAVKNTKSDLLTTNVNNLKMITTKLVLINQNNTRKKNLAKQMWHVDKEISDVNDLVAKT